MTDKIIIRRPDDWHVHLRDGPMLSQIVNFTAKQFKRAIIMPNLTPPVITAEKGMKYRESILKSVDPSLGFTPLMVCYLTDDIDKDEVESAIMRVFLQLRNCIQRTQQQIPLWA